MRTRKFTTMLAAASMVFFMCVTAVPASAATLVVEPFEGNFTVNIETSEEGDLQYIAGWGWGGPVTVTVDGAEVLTDEPLDAEGNFWIQRGDFGFKPGQHVVVTDGVNAEDTTIANLSITTIDLHTGRVAGTCSVWAGEVYPELAWDETHENPEWRTADCIDGTFEAFFLPSQLEEYPEGSFVEARQYDSGELWVGNITQVDEYYFYSPFNGIFAVSFSEGGYIYGSSWGGPVTVTVDGVEVMTITDVNSDECGGWTPLCFSEPFVSSEPGQHVVVSDGVNQKDLYLADVSITTIDVPTGRVTGTCSGGYPGTGVLLANGVGEELEFTCEDGTFERFFEPSFGWSSYVKVLQRDDDGDWTKDETSFFYDEDGLFWGFFSPVNYDEVNIAKAGRSIPVQWWLLDGEGVPVSNPASFFSITSSGAACGSEPTDAIEEYALGGSGIQYLGDGYWQLNWKTPKSYADQCRTVTLTLLDGSNLTASFMFT